MTCAGRYGVQLHQVRPEHVNRQPLALGLLPDDGEHGVGQVHAQAREPAASLVELDPIPAGGFDCAACLFSTLGMIRGRENRHTFLGHVRRVLKPGGVFVLHAHNAHYRFGRDLGRHGAEPGDRTMPQHRGGAELTIHHYTRGELVGELQAAGFRVREVLPVSAGPDGRLAAPWFLPGVRAYGYLVAAE